MAAQTNEQAQEEFINTLHRMVNYWMTRNLKQEPGLVDAGHLGDDRPIELQRLEGMVHTILCMLDGVAGYIKPSTVRKAIKGPNMLHELFAARERERTKQRLVELGIDPSKWSKYW